MKIISTYLSGVYIIKRTPSTDERGSFSRMFCKNEFKAVGITTNIAQINLSVNYKKHTLRGLHYQNDEAAEDKVITCINGEIYDVCVDIRKDSPTFGKWIGKMLSAENGLSLYIPKGFAHGFLTLKNNCHIIYFMSEFYKPGNSAGFKYDEPVFSIEWPIKGPFIISEQDRNWEYIKKLGVNNDIFLER